MNKLNKIVWIIIFAALIIVPLVGIKTFGEKEVTYIRTADKREPYTVKSWFDGKSVDKEIFEDYFNERMILRPWIIHRFSKLHLLVGVSSGPFDVVIGKDGWLFHKFLLRDDWRKVEVIDNEYIDKAMVNLNKINDYLNKNDKEFIYMITPRKHSIYPEYTPSYYTMGNSKSIYDLLLERSKGQTIENNILDMVTILKDKKEEYGDLLFYKTDGHWTEISAYLAYKEMMKKLNEFGNEYKEITIDDYSVKNDMYGFNYAFVLGVGEREDFKVDVDIGEREAIDPEYLTDEDNWKGLYLLNNEKALNDATLLVVGNSYMGDPTKSWADVPKQLFAHTFKRVYYFHYKNLRMEDNEPSYLQKVIEYYDVDIVLSQNINYGIEDGLVKYRFEFSDEEVSYDRLEAEFYFSPSEKYYTKGYKDSYFLNGEFIGIPSEYESKIIFQKPNLEKGNYQIGIVIETERPGSLNLEFYNDKREVVEYLTHNKELVGNENIIRFDINVEEYVSELRLAISGDFNEYKIKKFIIKSLD